MALSSQTMKLRSVLISILNKYQNANEVDNSVLKSDIEILNSYSDKDYMCKVLLKELANEKTFYANICAIIIMELIDNETLEKHALEILKSNEIKDDKKFFIVSVLKQKGLKFDYEDLNEYMENPQALAQNGVKDFLEDAINNPEVQLDLMDFYLNIPKEEKLYLLNNLLEEFEGDDLANALSLIAQLDVDDDEMEFVLNGLLKAKSPYGIEGLEYILDNYSYDNKITSIIKKALKEIKFKNPNFNNTAFVQDSHIHKSYMTFCDGQSNFTLSLSRIKSNGLLDAFFVTVNLMKGVTSCIGFSQMNLSNYLSVIKRLFVDTPTIELPPEALKALLKYYIEKNKKTSTKFPYEYIVWKKLMTDIIDITEDISDYLNKNLEKTNLNDKKVKKFLSATVLSKWYYLKGEREDIDKIIDLIEEKKVKNIEEINEIVNSEIENNFIKNIEFLKELQSRLLMQSYASYCAKLTKTSQCAYSMCYKSKYTKTLIESIIDKSIYCYFADCLDDENQTVFRPKTQTNFTKQELIKLMSELEAKWK